MKRRRYTLEFKEAAENGDPEAQIDLGLAYDFGNGVPQDYKEAVKLFRILSLRIMRIWLTSS